MRNASCMLIILALASPLAAQNPREFSLSLGSGAKYAISNAVEQFSVGAPITAGFRAQLSKRVEFVNDIVHWKAESMARHNDREALQYYDAEYSAWSFAACVHYFPLSRGRLRPFLAASAVLIGDWYSTLRIDGFDGSMKLMDHWTGGALVGAGVKLHVVSSLYCSVRYLSLLRTSRSYPVLEGNRRFTVGPNLLVDAEVHIPWLDLGR